MLKYLHYYKIYWISFKSKLLLYSQRNKYLNNFSKFQTLFTCKKGLEIGGPSSLFSNQLLPVYHIAKEIDGCNFSNSTIWEGNIISEDYNYLTNKKGKQIIAEGMDLSGIGNEQYDFILSCHNLELIANPLKALNEWLRIVKKGGSIMLVLPDKRFTFDRKRDYTQFAHLIEDFNNNIDESDMTHLEEILRLHDLDLDPIASKDFEAFKARCENNIENRCLHQHVYSPNLLKEIFEHLNIKVVSQYFIPPIHQIIVGIKQ